jgi:Zn-dependent protease with chaperone function
VIDWLATQYVLLLAKTAFFLQNPTACQWIEFFQVAGIGLGLAWAARTSYFAYRGHRVSERGSSRPTRSVDAVKLGAAFALVRERIANLAGGRFAKRAIDRWRIRIHPGPGVLLCNVGFFRPRILVSRKTIESLDTMELAAAIAHELTHVVRRDNLKRAAVEILCLLAPLGVWWAVSYRMAVSPPRDFLTALFLGLGAGLALRMILVPVVAYFQERRSDEWAALVVGDRLIVASALVKVASAASADFPIRAPYPATSFAFYQAPVSTRVRRLMSASGKLVLHFDRFGRVALRLLAAALLTVAGLAIHRAESQGLSGHVQFESCEVVLRIDG